MPGLGFVVFIVPVLLGVTSGVLLLALPKLRRFAAYAFLVPTVGALGALKGCDIGAVVSRPYEEASRTGLATLLLLVSFTLGGAIGSTCGAFAASLVNRLARR